MYDDDDLEDDDWQDEEDDEDEDDSYDDDEDPTCLVCGDQFSPENSNAEQYTTYCSVECEEDDGPVLDEIYNNNGVSSQHGNTLSTGKGDDGMAFSYGNKVTWNGQEATFQQVLAGFPNVAQIRLANGKFQEVHVGSLKTATPTDPMSRVADDVRSAVGAIKQCLRGPNKAQLLSLLRGATRGPDSGGQSYKSQTTGVLRQAVWGAEGVHFGGVSPVTPITASLLRNVEAQHGTHFATNVKQAAQALGIYDASK